MLTQKDIDSIQMLIPDLKNNREAGAIITHILENPSLNYPHCSMDLKSQILKVARIKRKPISKAITFIDLFAGIGGFRLAFESMRCKCVFSCEWDKHSKETYFHNFGVIPFGDIREIREDEIPDHDILCAGFPCQPFSIAGVSKKNSMGLSTGFEDKTQGTLFFDLKRIIEAKRPKAFFLENVKNLKSHDKGNTWAIIKETLDTLNYHIFYKIIDGQNWVPQHRERLFIVGFNKDYFADGIVFDIPEKPVGKYKFRTLDSIIETIPDNSLTLGPGTWKALQRHKAAHKAKGNGFGYSLLPFPIESTTITKTISARYYKDGAEILVPQNNSIPRKLSVKEAMQLQGFNPEKFDFPVGNNHAYKQIGNSVVVPAIKETGKFIVKEVKRIRNELGA
jgi:DNA (cytosine-5)-methyltransferase 1